MKIKMYVYAQRSDVLQENSATFKKTWRYTAWPYKETVGNTLGLFIGEAEVECPDVDEEMLVNGTVKLLKEKQQEARAKCETEVQRLEGQIGELLAIEDRSQA